ncbi:Uncharacterized protein SCF082_LOCUS30033 [Durusdinium trenchii]|uniref:Uncharacterized protein n=1 Tax=Durusdinium trenchii TaxID=1381693 RepID=A0ABP0MXZ6_9DINO
MDRALPPVVLGASIGSWAWWRSSFVSNLQDTAVRVVLDRGLALVTLVSEDLRADHLSCFVQVTAVLIVVHYRRELHFFVGLAFRGASALGKLLVEVLECICALLSWWVQLLHWSLLLAISPREQDTYFTSSDMAVVAGPPVPIGSFVLLSRPPEWDEVMVGAFTDNYNLAICKTTNGIGDAWIWWRPGAAEIPNIAAEANLILAQYNTSGAGWTVNVPGVAGPLVEIVAAGGGIPGPLAGGGGAAAAALPAGAGLGVGGGSPVGAQSQDLQALEAAVRDLQRMALSPGSRMSKSKKDKKKDRKKSSKDEKKSRPLRWKEHGKDRAVSYSDLTHVDALKLKRKGDLLAFASKNPGALTAHFLAGVYSRLSKGSLTRTGQLRDVSVTSWAHQFAGLTEIRDLKEVITLAEVLDSINRKEISRALDIICQRIIAIQSAKQKGGSWEKAEAVELIDTRNVGLRKAWYRRGGRFDSQMPFDDFYGVATKALMEALQRGHDELGFCDSLRVMLSRTGRGKCMHEFSKQQKDQGLGCGLSPANVFPLPSLPVDFSFAGVACSMRAEGLRAGSNLVLLALNWLHGGRVDLVSNIVTAAHRRIFSQVEYALKALVLTDEPTMGPNGLDHFLRQTRLYTGSGVVLALGVKGGVPEKAADVPLADHLQEHFPEMARQVLFPGNLLLPPRKRPRRVKRGFTWTAPTYPELVKKNVKAGLQKLKHPKQVARLGEKLVLAGAFAVKKDDKEDRVITDPAVNQLLDPSKLPRPRFAYIPALRSVTVPRTGVIAVSKRDARHYFHRLRIGRRWGRWLCSPSIELPCRQGGIRVMYPAAQSAPMGFGPSAGWAQGLTDVVARDAHLPEDSRLHPDLIIPEGLPLWGSIIDDIWALDHLEDESAAGTGPQWLQKAEEACCLRGVEPNHKKTVDLASGEEIQGYYVHPTDHWVGLAMDKRRSLFEASLAVLMKPRVVVGVIDRLIGKHSFLHSCRPPLRSIFQDVYPWIAEVRGRRRDLVELPTAVWIEICISTLLIPFAQFSLSSEWTQRVECTDASTTGLGRAYGVAPLPVVQAMARYSDHSRVYTNLKLPWSIGLTAEHKCPLRKIRLPKERIRWKFIGTPWTCAHITLAEADAIAWAAEDRLRRPKDDSCRFVHPVDSAACAGSFAKGRSSSHQLNKRCRRVAAVCLAGGHEVWHPWLPSKDNPADEPSRRFEPRGGAPTPAKVEAPASSPDVDLRELGLWREDTLFFIHFCSGPRRKGDLLDAVETLCTEHGIAAQGLAIDPLAEVGGMIGEHKADLLQHTWYEKLMHIIDSGRVAGGFGSPPCSTISAARHMPLRGRKPGSGSGPRPLRARANPWVPLDYCTVKERLAVDVGTALFIITTGLLGEIARRGGWVGLEHPADRGREPFPSFFATAVVRDFCAYFRLFYTHLDQCMYGAVSRKPTGILQPHGCRSLAAVCNHDGSHEQLLGLDKDGRFRTTPAAQYPSGLCFALADSFVQRLVFLLGSLRGSTVRKYALALEHLNNELKKHDKLWADMTEEEQDLFLAEWLVDGCEHGSSKTTYGWALSAVQKLFPRIRIRVAWKVYDAWGQHVPVRQAPAAPPEFLHAMASIAMLLNRVSLAALIVVCYSGLLRVREALQLRHDDVMLGGSEIVLCLGLTKRGTEQKVVLRNPSVVMFLQQYLVYTKRQGTPLADILVYGRWQTERSARDYIRQGKDPPKLAERFLLLDDVVAKDHVRAVMESCGVPSEVSNDPWYLADLELGDLDYPWNLKAIEDRIAEYSSPLDEKHRTLPLDRSWDGAVPSAAGLRAVPERFGIRQRFGHKS